MIINVVIAHRRRIKTPKGTMKQDRFLIQMYNPQYFQNYYACFYCTCSWFDLLHKQKKEAIANL
jgi:hypothetical protein